MNVAEGQDARVLRRLPHVRAVYEDRRYTPQLYASRDVLNVSGACRLANVTAAAAGRGVRVAMLDAGAYVRHEMFAGPNASWPPDIPRPGRGDTTNTNAKVPVSRLYDDPDVPPYSGDNMSYPSLHSSTHGILFVPTHTGVFWCLDDTHTHTRHACTASARRLWATR